ncbi:hypothetical protein tb265_36150 [Gemmatimonadetes bacterium T265]|nr:hypothetical protein tb265_36150 [Gemmatimonadetes bacterium T265]
MSAPRPADATIVLSSGPLTSAELPTGLNHASGMAPINGKPVIGWVLDELLFKNVRRVTLVMRDQNLALRRFVDRFYADRMELTRVALRDEGTIVQSLVAGLERTPGDGVVRVLLGDTLIRDTFEGDRDFVYLGAVDDSRRWCVARTGPLGEVVDLVDKQELQDPPFEVLAGYYHFRHGAALRAHAAAALGAGERELSDVLRRYMREHPLRAEPAREWFDFGHVDNIVSARRRLLQPRHFNALTINPVLNTITKVSQHTAKLEQELAWFELLPEELKVLTPRLIVTRDGDGNVQVSQEFYGYPTLAELYTYGDLPVDVWRSVLRHVLRIHQEFRRYPGHLEPRHVASMYADKTWARLDALRAQDERWAALLARETVSFQRRELRNVYALADAINARAAALVESAPVSVIHGDFCFSNILFDLNNQIVRLIDPRGSFGAPGIYGDARYDVAKLRHSVSGLYDFVMADLFDLSVDDEGFQADVYADNRTVAIAQEFDRMVAALGYDVNEIRLIEGLLFVSMVPYHRGHPHRQQMLYLTGLSLLNDVL